MPRMGHVLCLVYMIVRAYSCIVLLVSVLFFAILGLPWVNHYLHFIFSVFHIPFSCQTFWVVDQTAVHTYFFLLLSLFGTYLHMEILGAVGIWHIYFGGFCFDVYFTNTYNVGACFYPVYTVYTRFFARIHDLRYYNCVTSHTL